MKTPLRLRAPALLSRLLTGLMLTVAATVSLVAEADGNNPMPSFYQEPGFSSARTTLKQNADEHIDPFSGKLQWHHVDLVLPGNGGMDIVMKRSYTSLNLEGDYHSTVGMGWTMHFGRVLRQNLGMCIKDGDPPVFESSDGSRHVMYPTDHVNFTANAEFISTDMYRAQCDGTTLVVTTPDGVKYYLDTYGIAYGPAGEQTMQAFASRIVDVHGNTLHVTNSLVSGANMGPTRIASADGRYIDFTYKDGFLFTATASNGALWTYTNVGGFLTAAERPDRLSWQYRYDVGYSERASSNSMIGVTYPTQATTAYEYGFVRFWNMEDSYLGSAAIVRKTLDNCRPSAMPDCTGVWTFNYSPATWRYTAPVDELPVTFGARLLKYDTTLVEGPVESKYYVHFGMNSAVHDYGYMIGQLMVEATRDSNQLINWTSYFIKASEKLSQSWYPQNSGVMDIGVFAARRWQIKEQGTTRQALTTLTFDIFGNPLTTEETGNTSRTRTQTYHVDLDKWLFRTAASSAIENGPQIQRRFDINGNIERETKDGVNTYFTYNAQGDIATKTDARNNTVYYGSYDMGVPELEKINDIVTLTRVVDSSGNIIRETDGEGVSTEYDYDDMNRVVSIRRAEGNPVDVWYRANQRVVTRGASTETTLYDGLGRAYQRSISSPGLQTITTRTRYDLLGNKRWESYPNSTLGTCFEYFSTGELYHLYNECSEDFLQYTSVQSHIPRGSDWDHYNEAGKKTTYRRRCYNGTDCDVMAIDAPLAEASITFERDNWGRMTSATQAGKARSYHYDAYGFMDWKTDPEIGKTTMGYDAIGNMVSLQIEQSPASTYVYDERNRLTQVNYSGNVPPVATAYYLDGKVKSVDNGISQRNFVYTANKQLKTESIVTGSQSQQVVYAYDANDALSSVRYGSGNTVTYAPNAYGQPTQAAPYVTAIDFDARGSIKSMTYANGIRTQYEMNNFDLPSRISATKGTPLIDLNYTYDWNHNVSRIWDPVGQGLQYRDMQYDDLDRLTMAKSWNWQRNYEYSGMGDILGIGGFDTRFGTTVNLAVSHQYDTNNRLISVGSKNFTYDAHGNVSHNGTYSFTYNAADQLQCSQCGTTNESVYAYDGNGHRVKKSKNGIETYFFYGENGLLLWESTPSDHRVKEYIYVAGKQIAVREKIVQ